MLWKPLRLALLALLFVAFPGAFAQADAPSTHPPRVYVGLYLHDISDLSLGNGTYDIDADLWAKWHGDFDPNEIRFANASDIERETLEIAQDGAWHSARWRVRGTLRGDFPVQDFPLDRQAITVQLELPRVLGELVPDLAGSGIASRFSITDWNWSEEFRPVVTTQRYPSDLGSIAGEGRSAEVRRVSFEVGLQRPLMPVILKLFLPLAVVAMIVFLSLFVPPDTLQPRLTMCVTGLVACFAFQFSIADVMPAVAYLTLADTLFITVYILAIFCVAMAVAGHVLNASGRRATAEKYQRIGRIIAPIAMAIAVYAALPSFPQSEAAVLADPVVLERSTSARAVVRIGTTTPLRLASSPVGFASNWGLSFAQADGRQQALMVERMPRIDNDGMRFLADGTLAVAWRIREDANWSDGTPVTAADIELPLSHRPDDRVVSIERLDDRTVVLTWNERVVDALRAPALWPSAHLHETIGTENPDADAWSAYLSSAIRPTTGPYQVTASDASQIIGTRNPHFPLAPANIAQVEVHHFADSAGLREALLGGTIDITTPNALSADDFAVFEAHDTLRSVETPSATFVFLAVALTQPPWDAPEARRALLQAMNRQALASDEWGDAAHVANVPSRADQPDDFPRTAYDPAAARAAFDALGLLGTVVPLRWAPPCSEAFVMQIAADLEAAGLVPVVERIASSWPAWLRQDFDGLMVHQLRVERMNNQAQWWSLPSSAGRYQTSGRHDAWTDETSALIDQYDHALFRERRDQLRARIDRRWAESLPMIPLVFAGERVVVDRTLMGWERTSDGPFGGTIDAWYFAP